MKNEDRFETLLDEYLKESDENNPKRSKNRTSSFRYQNKQKHIKKRMEALKHGYKPSLGRDKGGYWVAAKNSKAQKYLKKISNKKVRKRRVGQYGGYKKVFDYYWEWF